MGTYVCHKCGAPWESDKRQPGFKETCVRCGAYLHCCLNCRHHRPSAHNQCYIPNTEYISNRSGLNFCEEFEFGSGPHSDAAELRKHEQARAAFKKIFEDDEANERVPASFEDLFKDKA